MQKIIPNLWFDNQAEEAVNFYISIFNNSRIIEELYYSEVGPGLAGSVMTVTFELDGLEFTALNGGPYFKFTPAISFFVNCETMEEINELWVRLSNDGMVLMAIDSYPFSERYGWTMDKYGVSWQLNLAKREQKITPFFMFVGDQHAKAEEAIHLYASLFQHSKIDGVVYYGVNEEEPEGTIKHAAFTLDKLEFMAMDSNMEHHFTFNEAVSLLVNCETQEEIDDLWEKLSEGGGEVECGWITDKFGVSWQIVPTILNELIKDTESDKSQSVMKAMLQMKKLDIEGLKQAYEGQ